MKSASRVPNQFPLKKTLQAFVGFVYIKDPLHNFTMRMCDNFSFSPITSKQIHDKTDCDRYNKRPESFQWRTTSIIA